MNAPLDLPTDLLDGRRPLAPRADGELRSTISQLQQLADRGDYREAAEQASQLLQDGVYDLRLACVYLVGLFMEQGMVFLPTLLDRVGRLVADEAKAPSHVRATPRSIDTTVHWLFQTIATRIQFHAKQRDETWSSWLSAPADLPRQIAEGFDQALATAETIVDAPSCAGAVAKTRRWVIKDFDRALAQRRAREEAQAQAEATARAEAAQEPDPPTPPVHEDEDSAWNEESEGSPDEASWEEGDDASWDGPSPASWSEESAESPWPSPEATEWNGHAMLPSPGPVMPAMVEESPALSSLREKLQGFELLVDKGDYVRAAIVAQDVHDLIEGFDPVTYLPSLFAGYFRTMSRHLQRLLPHLEQGDTSHGRVLSRFYQADLAGFVSDE